MNDHTKGPWSLRLGVFNYQTEIISGNDVLATVYGNTGENLRNAQIMRAAPELLEALDELANGYAGCMWDTGLLQRIKKARAAIAKVKGADK